jgi:hypothetical protein
MLNIFGITFTPHWLDPSWSMSTSLARRTSRSCMWCPLPQFWEGLHLLQQGTLAQSPIPCVQNLHCTLVPHVTQGMKQAMATGGCMSTLGQWPGPQNSELKTVTSINGKRRQMKPSFAWNLHETCSWYAGNMQEYAVNMYKICKN